MSAVGHSQQSAQQTAGRGYQTRSYSNTFLRWIFANNTRTTLAEQLDANEEDITVAPGEGMFLPHPGPGERVAACLFAISEGREILHEIIYIKSISGDVLTAERGQEGTGAREWPTGTPISLRVTRDIMADLQRFPGEVTYFLGDTPPTGWALLDGTGLAVADFPALFDLIGYRYGGNDGVFRLPTIMAIGNLPRPIVRLR